MSVDGSEPQDKVTEDFHKYIHKTNYGRSLFKVTEDFHKYIHKTNYGRSLLNEHRLDEVGIWKIFGEDPNADFHGSHYTPDLGIYEGKLQDIIMYGVALPKFWTWGAGGEFQYIGKSIPKIDSYSVRRRKELEAKAAELKAELDTINLQLGIVDVND